MKIKKRYGKIIDMAELKKENSVFYINLILAIILLLIVSLFVKSWFAKKIKVEETAPAKASMQRPQGAQPTVYDIDKIKHDGQKGPEKMPSDFAEMYANSKKSDVGDNMVEAWRKVSPEEKAKLSAGLDAEIKKSQEILKSEPENKHARNIMRISQILKNMTNEDFNYKFKGKK